MSSTLTIGGAASAAIAVALAASALTVTVSSASAASTVLTSAAAACQSTPTGATPRPAGVDWAELDAIAGLSTCGVGGRVLRPGSDGL